MQQKRPPSGSDGLALGFTACRRVPRSDTIALSGTQLAEHRGLLPYRRRMSQTPADHRCMPTSSSACAYGLSPGPLQQTWQLQVSLQRMSSAYLFLPSSPLLAGMMPRLSTQLLLIQFRLVWAIHAHANEGKHCKLRTIPNTTAGFFLTIGLQSYHLWQLCNKEPKFLHD